MLFFSTIIAVIFFVFFLYQGVSFFFFIYAIQYARVY